MARKKREHIVFDRVNKTKISIPFSKINQKTRKAENKKSK